MRIFLLCTLAVALSLGIAGTTPAVESPPYVYLSPFHPELCDVAVNTATEGGNCDMRMLAEGLYCRGLDDDPLSLHLAALLFARLRRVEPGEFFLTLEYAETMHKLYPHSDAAREALLEAHHALREADVGAARERLEQHLRQNLMALRDEFPAQWALPLVSLNAVEDESSRAASTIAFAVAQRGPSAAADVASALKRRLTATPDDPIIILRLAEFAEGWTGAGFQDGLAQAVSQLCPLEPECDTARRRLTQYLSIKAALSCVESTLASASAPVQPQVEQGDER